MQHRDRDTLLADLEKQEYALSLSSDAARRAIYLRTIAKINSLLRQSPVSEAPKPVPVPPAAARKVRMANPDPLRPSTLGGVTLTVIANNAGPATITIEWQISGEIVCETLTEGTCRGRFVTYLRDILESKPWKQDRKEKAATTTCAWRAAGYYQALHALWGRPPTLRELGIHPSRYGEVFGLITATPPPAPEPLN